MMRSCGTCSLSHRRRAERGESRIKFLIVLAIIIFLGYLAYQFVPIMIQSYQFKDAMQQTVNTAVIQQTPVETTKKNLRERAIEYGAPQDAEVTVVLRDNRVEATVQFTRAVPLVFYTYQYNFNHTVKSFDPLTLK